MGGLSEEKTLYKRIVSIMGIDDDEYYLSELDKWIREIGIKEVYRKVMDIYAFI